MAKIWGQLERAQLENLSADPSGAGLVTGRSWFNTASGLAKYYDGSVIQTYGSLSASADSIAASMTTTGTGSLVTTMTAANTDTIAGKVTSTGTTSLVTTMTTANADSIISKSSGNVVSSVSATTTLTTSDHVSLVVMTTSTTNRTVNLPAAASSAGRIITIKKADASTGKVIVDANASETIDGALTLNIYGQNGKATIQCTGSAWMVIQQQSSPWVSADPTMTSFGTVSGTSFWMKQLGDTLYCRGTFKAGTVAASVATISLPTGPAIDSTKLASTAAGRVGTFTRVRTAVGPTIDSNPFDIFFDGSDTSAVYITFETGSNVFTKMNASDLVANSDNCSFEFSVPIL